MNFSRNTIDPDEGKPLDDMSSRSYLEFEGEMAVEDWFDDNVRIEDRLTVYYNILSNVRDRITFANFIRDNYSSTPFERRQKVLEVITREGTATIVIGVRGAGKTAAVISVAEDLLHMGHTVYWYGFHAGLAKAYPKIVQSFDWMSFREGTIIMDEGAMLANAREAMTKEAVSRVRRFATVRHKGQSLIFIVQSISEIDLSILRNATLIWFKSTPFDDIFKRGKEHNLGISGFFKYIIPQNSQKEKHKNAVYNRETKELFTFETGLPTKWTDEVSKPYALVTDRNKAKEIYYQMDRDQVAPRIIRTIMEAYGWNVDSLFEDESFEEHEEPVKKAVKKARKSSGRPSMLCPGCGSSDFKFWGTMGPKQRLMCNRCGKTWTIKGGRKS